MVEDPARILIVDDVEENRVLLSDFIAAFNHTPILAKNGNDAVGQMEKGLPDLVLLDIMMPGMDGYEVLEHMKNDTEMRHLPVVMISAVDEMDSIVRCIERGADDYLLKPFNPTLLKARITACLEKKHLHDQKEDYRRQIEEYNLNLEKRVREQVEEITSAQMATIFSMARLAEARDPETGKHLERMREYSRIICEKLRLLPKYASIISEDYIENTYTASPLHDIGKVGIPDRILQKPGKLTEEEFAVMETHAIIGADTLRSVAHRHPENIFVQTGIELAENHHEKWNGTGYPHGLAGEKIPLRGRILALSDVYDALTSKRCYKEAFSHADSRKIILEERGKHFDPDVVETFLSAEEEFIAAGERYGETMRK